MATARNRKHVIQTIFIILYMSFSDGITSFGKYQPSSEEMRDVGKGRFQANPEFPQLSHFLYIECLYFTKCIVIGSFLVSLSGSTTDRNMGLRAAYGEQCGILGIRPNMHFSPKSTNKPTFRPVKTRKETKNDKSIMHFVKIQTSNEQKFVELRKFSQSGPRAGPYRYPFLTADRIRQRE